MPEIKPITNDHPGDWHLAKFIEFAHAKDIIGEPTPHMRVVDYLCQGTSTNERMWRTGCYLTGYSVLTGEGIWNSWPWRRVCGEGNRFLLPWLEDNWEGIHTRKPRRCVRTPRQFAACLLGYRDWMQKNVPYLRKNNWGNTRSEYDGWWESSQAIPYFGRYISIRLLECFRRWGLLSAHLYDIRAVGAHSPIRCLMLLCPEQIEALSTGDAKVVDLVAQKIKSLLMERGLKLSYFTYATLLCEYRGCYEDGGDYAGNQHDEELEYSLSRYADYWRGQGLKSRLYEARAAIDPHECLGEIQGWQKRRTDVAKWMRARGIVWSDVLYDYKKSVASGFPVLRGRKGHGVKIPAPAPGFLF